MPDQPAEKIASILRLHFFIASWEGEGCGCNSWRGPLLDWYTHLAEALVSELGLSAETAFRYTHNASGLSTIIESTSADVRIARKIAGDTHTLAEVARYVTEWQAL